MLGNLFRRNQFLPPLREPPLLPLVPQTITFSSFCSLLNRNHHHPPCSSAPPSLPSTIKFTSRLLFDRTNSTTPVPLDCHHHHSQILWSDLQHQPTSPEILLISISGALLRLAGSGHSVELLGRCCCPSHRHQHLFSFWARSATATAITFFAFPLRLLLVFSGGCCSREGWSCLLFSGQH